MDLSVILITSLSITSITFLALYISERSKRATASDNSLWIPETVEPNSLTYYINKFILTFNIMPYFKVDMRDFAYLPGSHFIIPKSIESKNIKNYRPLMLEFEKGNKTCIFIGGSIELDRHIIFKYRVYGIYPNKDAADDKK